MSEPARMASSIVWLNYQAFVVQLVASAAVEPLQRYVRPLATFWIPKISLGLRLGRDGVGVGRTGPRQAAGVVQRRLGRDEGGRGHGGVAAVGVGRDRLDTETALRTADLASES